MPFILYEKKMKKIWIFLLGASVFAVSATSFAAKPTTAQLKDFSTKLENHKTTLLKNIENSKKKLKTIADETNKFADTTLFKAAGCLGAIAPENQNLDYTKITSGLQETILNEWIKLDGDIKRLTFGLTESDPIVFGNTLDTFYNQNAIKITNLENDYYLKTSKVKKEFLEYVENNKALLTQLAQNMDYITTIQTAASRAVQALTDFSNAIAARSEMLKTIEKSRIAMENNFEAELEAIVTKAITKNQPSDDIQAKYLIHKNNFLKKFRTDINQAQYALFSAFFSYPDYAELLEKKADVEKQFLTSSGAINCNLLLTTTFNLGNYAKNVEDKSEKIQKGLKVLTDATKNGKLNVKMIEAPTISNFSDAAELLHKKLITNFRLMLDSEKTTWVGTQETAQTTETAPQAQTPEVKTTFTQAFNKGQYHEQIKTLQTVLKNWGYYQGEINGIYSAGTIEAVYKFQLKEGVITGKEKNKAGYGRFGVATRNKMNSLL